MFSPRICIIGAGPSGIAAAKNMLQAGLENLVVFERNMEVGGNWVYSPRPSHSSVFETTHIISSKSLSEYEDFPMPAHYPDYPSHTQLKDYFQSYAKHFGVEQHIRFGTGVSKVERTAQGKWLVTLDDGAAELFDYLLVSNGHHWSPRTPVYPGTFTGEFLHSHEFKNNEPFRDRRVLVIGGGNSACDIAVETCRVSSKTAISMRRGYYFVPKFLFGVPSDVVAARFKSFPLGIRLPLMKLALRLNVGDLTHYGLPAPDHQLMRTHPTVNSELLYFIRHGRVHPRVDIDHYAGREVHFKDGTVEEFDVIIAATGFKIEFPFFDSALIDFSTGSVPLYLRVFHPEHENLFFIGLVQPIGCIWPLADFQSQLVASYIQGKWRRPPNMEELIEQETSRIARNFIDTPRHTVEVDYHQYRKTLLQQIPNNNV